MWQFILAVVGLTTFLHYAYKVYLSFQCKSAPYLRNRLLKYVGVYHIENDAVAAVDDEILLNADNIKNKKISAQRKQAYKKLAQFFTEQKDTRAKRIEQGAVSLTQARSRLADGRFGLSSCVPFYFKKAVDRDFDTTMWVEWTSGPLIGSDIDDVKNTNSDDVIARASYDLSGSFGLNVAGHTAYKSFLDAGAQLTGVGSTGIALGSINTVMLNNISKLCSISGQESVSFHNSGTEAVMSAVRLAKFNIGRPYTVVFKGAYHGWWDALLQTSTTEHNGILTLKEANEHSLKYIEYEGLKISAVVVNPMQAFAPNSFMPVDATLINGASRTYNVGSTSVDSSPSMKYYRAWLAQLRVICSDLGIALIFDEVYSGFRISRFGAQELFGVKADIVCYGKSVGGGLPVGVVCGKRDLLAKSDSNHLFRRADIQGTFCAAPTVMASMNAFLNWLTTPETEQLYKAKHQLFDEWTAALNSRLEQANLPVRISHWHSLLCFEYTARSHYNWLFQYYLRKNRIYLSWTGTGRCLLSLDYDASHLSRVADRIFDAATEMSNDGWWYDEKTVTNLTSKIVTGLLWSSIVVPIKDYWNEIEMHKRIDDEVAHKHPVNQMFHVISSVITLFTYILFARGSWGLAIVLTLVSQTIRQSGHFFFERSPPGAERAKIGFDTVHKKCICVLGAIGYVAAAYSERVAEVLLVRDIMHAPLSLDFFVRYLVIFFAATFLSKAVLVMHKSDVRLGILWLTKIATDPFTDIQIYGGSFKRVYYRYFATGVTTKTD